MGTLVEATEDAEIADATDLELGSDVHGSATPIGLTADFFLPRLDRTSVPHPPCEASFDLRFDDAI